MKTSEIKSPEGTETPASPLGGDNVTTGGKKLGVFFVESDSRRTPLGRGYTGGTTPVNIRGKPIAEADLSKTGGWLAAFFIFGNESAERLAYYGLAVNMVPFMFMVMHRSFSSSYNAVNNFLGVSQASSLLGGFLADAYLGRYWTIAIFTSIYLIGLAGITLCATMKVFMPNQDCNQLALLSGKCEPASSWQIGYLYTFLYTAAFGAAGIRPCVSSFGADQFDEKRKDYKEVLDKFFNFFFLCLTVGAIVAFTLVVYIQREHGWGAAFCSLAIAMGISNVMFFVGTPMYRHRLPGGSPLTRIAQVLVAAFRKRNVPFARSELVGLYEVPGKHSAIKGSGKIPHTDSFRCLDKAALRLNEDGPNPSPWRLCTVTQVEEVKILVKLVPVTSSSVMITLVLTEYLTLTVQQAYTLNRNMGTMELPVNCIPAFPALAILLLMSIYYSVIVPLLRLVTKHPHGASQLQKVGIGLALSVISTAWAGGFERIRRNYAIDHGYEQNFLTPMPNLRVYWLIIQYSLLGIAEIFSMVGILEFLYQEAPDAMKSIGTSYSALAGGIGCFGGTIMNNIIKSVTANPDSWLSQNINTGRFDYFYWLLTVLGAINFCWFLVAAHRYKSWTELKYEVATKSSPVIIH